MFVIPVFLAVIVKFIQITLGKNPHKDVFPTLLNELKASHFLRFTETQEELSAALQRMVKERRMSWFCFAQYLLRSERTRPFIFAFADHTSESLEWNCPLECTGLCLLSL